ncbi:MAG: hypothetical protein KBA26_10820 [Candidatus Delongbacteria bacterium]|nr:hypothetical protein [Candidatus Delongbacteria bacterium]
MNQSPTPTLLPHPSRSGIGMLTGAFYPEISGAGLQALTLCRSLSGQ